jgi:hypothetical protein
LPNKLCDVLNCYCSGDEIKKDEIIGECVTYEEQEKSCIVSVGKRGSGQFEVQLENKSLGLHVDVLIKRMLCNRMGKSELD